MKKLKFSILFISLLFMAASVGLYGCAKKKTSSSKVLAIVNGRPITTAKFQKEISKFPPTLRSYLGTPAGEKKLLKSLVDRQMLVNEALKQGVNKSKAYKTQLSDFKKGLLVQLLLRKEVTDKVKINEADAKAYYKKHYLSFNLPSKINVSYIQTDTMSNAKTAYAAVKGGKPFPDAAKQYSSAPNAKTGGLLGWIKFQETTPAFNNAAFSISEVGGISKIVKVGSHYDIIMLNKVVTGKPKPFKDVESEIKIMMKQDEASKVLKSFIKGLKAKSKVKYFYANLPAASSPEGQPGESDASAGTVAPKAATTSKPTGSNK